MHPRICDDYLITSIPTALDGDTSGPRSTVAIFDLRRATTDGSLRPKFLVVITDFRESDIDCFFDGDFLITVPYISSVESRDLRFCEPYTGLPVECSWEYIAPRSYFASMCGRLVCLYNSEIDSLVYDLHERKVLCKLPNINNACFIDTTQLLIQVAGCIFHVDLSKSSAVGPPAVLPAPTTPFIQFGLMTRKHVKGKLTPCLYRAHTSDLSSEICHLLRVESVDQMHRTEILLKCVSSQAN